jgi:predicted DNA-binding transcriptional regulator YafY
MAEKDDVRWGMAQRFELIEWRAFWLGRVNRSDLEERFGVSTPQASVDLRSYQEAVPNNIEYDATAKAYVPTSTFTPKYFRVSADRYLIQLNAILNGAVSRTDTWFGSLPPAAVMQTVVRSVEPDTLRAILNAIMGRHELEVVYQSLTNTRARTIVPHSLAFDGHRWHARAWCVEHRDFRDFVLSRILSVSISRSSDVDPSNDMEWNTMIDLKIVAHPYLGEAQKSAIERDFGMENGVLIMRTRAALAFYFIKRLNLDLDSDQITPERKQISLSNFAEIVEMVNTAKAETRARVNSD